MTYTAIDRRRIIWIHFSCEMFTLFFIEVYKSDYFRECLFPICLVDPSIAKRVYPSPYYACVLKTWMPVSAYKRVFSFFYENYKQHPSSVSALRIRHSISIVEHDP